MTEQNKLSISRTSSKLAEEAKMMRDNISRQAAETVFAPNIDAPNFFDLCIKEFANGNIRPALNEMVKKFKQQRGMGIHKKYWYCLFDCYMFINDQEKFDKIANTYSKTFDLSPPGWVNIKTEKIETINSRSVLSIVDNPNKISKEKFIDFVKTARETKMCRIELSRIDLNNLDKLEALEGLQKLYDLMNVIEVNGVHCDIIGDITLNQQLSTIIKEQIERKRESERIYWDIYLKLLQWRGEEEIYNGVHSQYALFFDEMPLDFRPQLIMKREDNSVFNFNDKSIYMTDEAIELPNVINRNEVQTMINIIKNKIAANKHVEFDFSNVKLFNYLAANDLAKFLIENEDKLQSKIRFFNVFQIIACLFDLTAISKKVAVAIHKY